MVRKLDTVMGLTWPADWPLKPAGRWTLVVAAVVAFSLLAPSGGWANDQVDVTGTVVYDHGDDFENRREYEYVVLDTGRERFNLEGVRARGLREGQRIRVRAARRGGTIHLASNSTITDQGVAAAGSADATTTTSDSTGTATVSSTSTAAINKKVAVLLINFMEPSPTPSPTPEPTPEPTPSPEVTPEPSLDPLASPDPSASVEPTETPDSSPAPTPEPTPEPTTAPPTASPTPSPSPTPPPQPWTLSQVRGIYFNNTKSAASYFDEVSNGRISVSGDVYGWFTLTASTATCDYNGWANAARNAATAAGVNLTSFTNYVYAFPKVQACPWGGLASVNGPHSWINGKVKMNLYVTTHELGHNFGTHHAATLRCTSGGVRVAFSSNCTSNEYGDPFDIMGGNGSYSSTFHVNNWARRQIGALTTADQQTVTANGIYSVANAQTVGGSPRILRVRRPAGDFFYLEHRQPYGLFDTWSASAPVVNGVTIRLAPATKRIPSQLIDTTPETTTFNDAALAVGRTFTDPIGGITITTLALSSSGATVRIQVGPDVVAPTAPGNLAAALDGSGDVSLSWTAASDDLEVAGYVVARDGVEAATVAGLSFVDGGLPQASTYAYTVTAFDGGANFGPPATLSVYLPDTTPPSAVESVSSAQVGQRAVSVAWGSASDNIGVTGYRVMRNGSVLVETTDLAHDDESVIDGFTYQYDVRALDAAGNLGPSVSASPVSLPDVTPPTEPGAVISAGTAGETARIEWTPASDNVAVAGYTVSRDDVLLATLDAGATNFSETSLPEGTYQYEVRAFDAAGNVGPAMVAQAKVVLKDVTPPSVPAGLTGTAQDNRVVQLSWQASTDDRADPIRYRVFRNGVAIGTQQTALTYTDQPSTTGSFGYQVRAIDAAGNRSALSPSITVQVVNQVSSPSAGPAVPQGLTGTAHDNFVAKLAWQPVTSSGTTYYRVFRNGKAIGTKQTATTFTDQRKKANTFRYQVRAIDSAGRKSALSPSVTVTTVKSTGSSSLLGPDTTPPSIPANLSTQAQGYRYVNVAWQPSTDDRPGSIEYRLFRNDRRIAILKDVTTFTDRPKNAGTHRYKVRAIDAAGNKSAFSPAVTGQAIKGPL